MMMWVGQIGAKIITWRTQTEDYSIMQIMAGKGEINGQRGRQCRKMLRPETFTAFHISVHIYITKAIIKKSSELNIHIHVVIITVIKYLFTI